MTDEPEITWGELERLDAEIARLTADRDAALALLRRLRLFAPITLHAQIDALLEKTNAHQ